ncbi:MAG: DUF4396 domain-containing protein [Rhodanobacteraceae bacterium]
MPIWLIVLAWVSLGTAFASALVIALDLIGGHRQHMWIMNLVWPITALYAGPLALVAYFRVGRLSSHRRMQADRERGEQPAAQRKPFWQMVGVSDSHCGAGCTLGDIAGGWIVFVGAFEIAGLALWPEFIADYALAFILGIAFQYFTIAPIRGLGVGEGIVAALKADTLALTSFEFGLFGWMALVQLVFFPIEHVHPDSPVYWFLMQVGMLLGFLTSYPVNAWLLKAGLKEAM